MTTTDAEARPRARGDGGAVLAGGPPRAMGRLVSVPVSLSVRPVVPGRPSVSSDRVLRWHLPEPPPRLTADPLVPTLLLLAMRRGEDLRLEGGVSPRLLAATEAVQDLILGWDADVRRRRTIPTPPQRRALLDATAA